jgi:hypothetical protein
MMNCYKMRSKWFLSVLGNRLHSSHKLKPKVSAQAVSDT